MRTSPSRQAELHRVVDHVGVDPGEGVRVDRDQQRPRARRASKRSPRCCASTSACRTRRAPSSRQVDLRGRRRPPASGTGQSPAGRRPGWTAARRCVGSRPPGVTPASASRRSDSSSSVFSAIAVSGVFRSWVSEATRSRRYWSSSRSSSTRSPGRGGVPRAGRPWCRAGGRGRRARRARAGPSRSSSVAPEHEQRRRGRSVPLADRGEQRPLLAGEPGDPAEQRASRASVRVVSSLQQVPTIGSTSVQTSAPRRPATSAGYDAASAWHPPAHARRRPRRPRARIIAASPAATTSSSVGDVRGWAAASCRIDWAASESRRCSTSTWCSCSSVERESRLVGVQLDELAGARRELVDLDRADRWSAPRPARRRVVERCEQQTSWSVV